MVKDGGGQVAARYDNRLGAVAPVVRRTRDNT